MLRAAERTQMSCFVERVSRASNEMMKYRFWPLPWASAREGLSYAPHVGPRCDVTCSQLKEETGVPSKYDADKVDVLLR